MKVHKGSELQQKAQFLFQDLEKDYRACEVVYILSEVMRIQSLAMLQEAA